MKKRMMSMALCLCMALSLAVPTWAVEESETLPTETETISEDEMVINDAEFLANASVTKEDLGNHVTQYTFIEERPMVCAEIDEKEELEQTAAVILTTSEEDAQAVENVLRGVVNQYPGETTPVSKEFLNRALYLEVKILFVREPLNGVNYFMLQGAKTKIKAGSSIKVNSKKILFDRNGRTADGSWYKDNCTVSVNEAFAPDTNGYRFTAVPSQWKNKLLNIKNGYYSGSLNCIVTLSDKSTTTCGVTARIAGL